jgi:ABC-type phosphate/phosphonate transport system substrate-binding protein
LRHLGDASTPRARGDDGLRTLAWTDSAPNLPYVTAIQRDDETVQRLRDGLAAAFAPPDGRAAREALFLEGIEVLGPETYQAIDAMEQAAFDLAYPDLT